MKNMAIENLYDLIMEIFESAEFSTILTINEGIK